MFTIFSKYVLLHHFHLFIKNEYFKAEIEKKASNNEKAVYLQLMANNVEPLLISAAENKKLTDFLMAAAITGKLY